MEKNAKRIHKNTKTKEEKMDNLQTYTAISKDDLLKTAAKMKAKGHRLVQISVTKKEKFDLIYSFADGDALVNFRVEADESDGVESISSQYSYAYIYENEMKDLFGVNIMNINPDFGGNFYKTSVKTPFNIKPGLAENTEEVK